MGVILIEMLYQGTPLLYFRRPSLPSHIPGPPFYRPFPVFASYTFIFPPICPSPSPLQPLLHYAILLRSSTCIHFGTPAIFNETVARVVLKFWFCVYS